MVLETNAIVRSTYREQREKVEWERSGIPKLATVIMGSGADDLLLAAVHRRYIL